MKKILSVFALGSFMLMSVAACAQNDKSKRPSPPAKATETIKSGAVITIEYSQPAVKGRTIGKDLEPIEGKIWRTGANEATVFQTDKDIKVNGEPLPAGKYALFTINEGTQWTIIFNKKWDQWGAFKYKQDDDALRVITKGMKPASPSERMTFTISKEGMVSLAWGDTGFSFSVN